MNKKPFIEERPYQDDDILIFIAGLMVFLSAIIIFWPYVTTEADAECYGRSWYDSKQLYIEQFDLDAQKTNDIWKQSKKSDYEKKHVTLQMYIWSYLTTEMGLGDIQAAGIFGNMMVECGGRSFNLQPYIYSPGGNYYGLCQWNTSGHHRSITGGTVDEQLDYLSSTIRGEMDEFGYSQFEASTTPESAAYSFARWYERCADPSGRGSEARRAYDYFCSEL